MDLYILEGNNLLIHLCSYPLLAKTIPHYCKRCKYLFLLSLKKNEFWAKIQMPLYTK